MNVKVSHAENGRISFWCPGCDRAHTVETGPGRWDWNSSKTAPTFTPSVLVHYRHWEPPVTPENLEAFKAEPWEQHQVDVICHSFVTDGRIQFLGDSTHSLAGHTVDLPNWNAG